jgi:hypothetical protein
LAELKKLGLNEANPAASAPAATLTVQVGAARHSGTARVAFQ